MRNATALVLLFFVSGCGGGTGSTIGGGSSGNQSLSASSWVGTWSGKVDWVTASDSTSDPSLGDSATITIGTPVTSNCPTTSCTTEYTFQFSGTDTGPQLGNVKLTGSFVVYSNDLNGSIVSPTIVGNPYSTAIEPQEVWQLSGSSITMTGIGTNSQHQSISLLMGTLLKQ